MCTFAIILLGFVVAASSEMAKIVNGKNAKVGRFPFMVSLRTKDGGFRCGGALLTDSLVVTARHCVKNSKGLTVLLGDYNRISRDSSEQSVDIKEYLFPDDQSVDLAILVLNCQPLINDKVKTINLGARLPDPGQTVMAAGWGNMKSGNGSSLSNELQYIELPRLSQEECSKNMKKHKVRTLKDSEFCAGYNQMTNAYKNACHGDSGSPVFHKNNSTFELLGIVVRGVGFCPAGAYALYENLNFPPINSWLVNQTLVNRNLSSCSLVASPPLPPDLTKKKKKCLPGDSLVLLADGSEKTVSTLTSGDRTVGFNSNGKPETSHVITYLHSSKTSVVDFLTLSVMGGDSVTLSHRHLILSCKACTSQQQATYKFAEHIQVGDRIFKYDRAVNVTLALPVQVSEIHSIAKQGFYAPLTQTGNLVTNGFIVSSYAQVESQTMCHIGMSPLRLAYWLFPSLFHFTNRFDANAHQHWYPMAVHGLALALEPSHTFQ